MPSPVSLDADQKEMYEKQREIGRKELWKEALESSSHGNYFLVSLLEVVLEDEAEQAEELKKQQHLQSLIKTESRTIPYTPSAGSDRRRRRQQ